MLISTRQVKSKRALRFSFYLALQPETRSSRSETFFKIGVLKSFAKFMGKQLCQRPQARNFIKKEALGQIFSFEFCENFKNTFFLDFLEHLR